MTDATSEIEKPEPPPPEPKQAPPELSEVRAACRAEAYDLESMQRGLVASGARIKPDWSKTRTAECLHRAARLVELIEAAGPSEFARWLKSRPKPPTDIVNP